MSALLVVALILGGLLLVGVVVGVVQAVKDIRAGKPDRYPDKLRRR
jgi:flagellar biosynthesis protein FliQ